MPVALPSSTDEFQTQTMLSKSLQLSKGSDGHILMIPSLKDSKRREHLLTATGHIINHGDDRLETQPPPQHVNKGGKCSSTVGNRCSQNVDSRWFDSCWGEFLTKKCQSGYLNSDPYVQESCHHIVRGPCFPHRARPLKELVLSGTG